MKTSILKEKSFALAVSGIDMYKKLVSEQKEFVLSKQMLRSSTAVGALIREAQNAESAADFIHKLSIAQKECDETLYWIELLKETCYLTEANSNHLYCLAGEVLKIIKSSILTVKNRRKNSDER